MGQEIERKFLVSGDGWRSEPGKETEIVQGYIAIGDKAQVRVRILNGTSAVITIKDRKQELVRQEFEYPIPLSDARAMLALHTGNLIEKTRRRIQRDGIFWEIDCFRGELDGLILAEVELDVPEKTISLPDWLGREVTGDPNYYNVMLALGPEAIRFKSD